jgi:hypothetical protein
VELNGNGVERKLGGFDAVWGGLDESELMNLRES